MLSNIQTGRRMIDRSTISEPNGRRSPQVPYKKPDSPSRRFEARSDRNRRGDSPSRNGNGRNREYASPVRGRRDRSRSPYQTSHRYDSRDRAGSRSTKRLRRRSPSYSPGLRRRDSSGGEGRVRRRSRSAQSPRHHRDHHYDPSRRRREALRPTHSSSPDSYKRSKRRYSRSPSPHNHRHRSRDRVKHRGKRTPSLSPLHPSASKHLYPLSKMLSVVIPP